MNLEDIEKMIDEAERTGDVIFQDLTNYTDLIDSYQGKAPEDSVYRVEGEISRDDLIEETLEIAETVYRSEVMLDSLERGLEHLYTVNRHRYLPDQERKVEDIESDLLEMVDLYRDNLDYGWESLGRVSKISQLDADIPDPLEVVSLIRKDAHKVDEDRQAGVIRGYDSF